MSNAQKELFKIDILNNILFKYQKILAVLIISFFTLIAYSNSFHNGFIDDDNDLLIGEKSLRNMSLIDLYTKQYTNFYRPFAFMFLRWANILFNSDPIPYQIFNFVIFLIACVLCFFMLLKLFGNYSLCLLATLLYAVHPIDNILVNHKSAVNNTIFVICMLLSTFMYIKYLEKNSKIFLIISLVMYFFSLMSHEISFILPVYLLLISYYLNTQTFKKSLLPLASYLIVFLMYFYLRGSISDIRGVTSFNLEINFFHYIEALIKLIFWYTSKLFIPINTFFIWDEPIPHKSHVIYCVIFLLILFLLIIFHLWRKNIFSISFLIFMVGFIPISLASFTYSRYIYFNTAIIEPHWFGFSSIFFFVMIANTILVFLRNTPPTRKIIIYTLIIISLALLTRKSNIVWKDQLNFATYWLKNNEYNNRALILLRDSLIQQFDKGLDVNQYNNCHDIILVGSLYFADLNETKAKQYYELALTKNANCLPPFYFFWGIWSFKHGDLDQAKNRLEQAHQIKPDFYPSYESLFPVLEKVKYNDQKSVREIYRLLFGLDKKTWERVSF